MSPKKAPKKGPKRAPKKSPKKAPKQAKKEDLELKEEKTTIKVIYPKEDEIRELNAEEKPFSIEELNESISWSTRKIYLKAKGCSTLFNLVALSEKKKYGSTTSVKMGENQDECVKASLSLVDNLVFLPAVEFEGEDKLTKKEVEEGIEVRYKIKKIPSGIKKGVIRIDEDGDYIHRSEIEEYDEDEKLLPKMPSSLHFKNAPTEIEITDVATVEDILDTNVSSRYFLFPDKGESDLDFKDLINNLETVDDPKFLTFKFNYTASTQQKDAYLLLVEEDDEEYILMCVGTKLEMQWVGLEEIPEENMYIGEEMELDLDLSL